MGKAFELQSICFLYFFLFLTKKKDENCASRATYVLLLKRLNVLNKVQKTLTFTEIKLQSCRTNDRCCFFNLRPKLHTKDLLTNSILGKIYYKVYFQTLAL